MRRADRVADVDDLGDALVAERERLPDRHDARQNGDAEDFFDVHDYIDLCKEHYEKVGLGAGMIDALLR